MRFLLDTHPFLWLVEDDKRLSKRVRRIYEDPDNEIALSLASMWEMAIKVSLGKLTLATGLHDLLDRAAGDQGLEVLPIKVAHVKQVADLPFHHRDPFDRLIAAQALIEQVALISQDEAFDAYGVRRCWA